MAKSAGAAEEGEGEREGGHEQKEARGEALDCEGDQGEAVQRGPRRRLSRTLGVAVWWSCDQRPKAAPTPTSTPKSAVETPMTISAGTEAGRSFIMAPYYTQRG